MRNITMRLFYLLTMIFIITPKISALTWETTTVDSGGNVGIDNDIAVDSSDKVHISYYDSTNKNLKYATNKDGYWAATTIGSSTADLGKRTSIAIDSQGKAHISYFDNTRNKVMYVTNGGGSWGTTTIDSASTDNGYSSIAIDSLDSVHISYSSQELKYATNKTGAWGTTTVDSSEPYGNKYNSIAIDSSDNMHISYREYEGNFIRSRLKYATNKTGLWEKIYIEYPGSTGTNVGVRNSIAVDSADNVHISYEQAVLRYATNKTGEWEKTTIYNDTGNNHTEPSSIALDSSNNVHISHNNYSGSAGKLLYTTNKTGAWVTTTLDDTVTVDAVTSIAIDSLDNIHISYIDSTNDDLKYAKIFGPPKVTTESATNLTSTTATLNGAVHPNGLSTSVWFEYDTDSGSPYTHSTASQSVNSGDYISVNEGTSGLQSNTTYYYRIAASNGDETSYGDELSFNTLSEPTAIEIISFTAETDGSDAVTLKWETATEINNTGFNLYRSRIKDNNYKKINNGLIAARGSETEGVSYSYVDTPPSHGTYYYKLEDADVNGVKTLHGPVKVRIRGEGSEARMR